MRTFCHTLIATILGITPLTGFAQVPGPGGQAVVLARVDLAGPPQSYGLPVHAFLQDGAGQEYLLVLNSEGNLRLAGWPYRVLDASAAEPEAYLLAAAKRPGAREAAGTRFRVVLDDGAQWIVRATAEEAEELADLGFALQRLTRAPITWSKPPARVARQAEAAGALPALPAVEAMLAVVNPTNLFWLVHGLSGEQAVLLSMAAEWRSDGG